MGRTTGLHADHHRQLPVKIRQHLTSFELPTDDYRFFLVNTMELKDALCQVDTHTRNLHGGLLFLLTGFALTAPVWHFDAVRGEESIPLTYIAIQIRNTTSPTASSCNARCQQY